MRRLLPLAIVVVLAAGCAGSHQASSSCTSGPSEFVLRALPGNGQPVTSAGMQLAAQIMTDRVDRIGVASPKVTVAGDEITIQFAGLHEVTKDISLVGSTGELQFFDFEKDLAPPTVNNGNPTPYPTLFSLLERIQGQVNAGGGPSAYYLFGTKTMVSHRIVNGERITKKTKIENALLAGPDFTHKQLLAGYRGHKPSGTTILAVPANREVVSGPVETAATQPVKRSPDGIYWYLFNDYPDAPNGPPELTGTDLKESAIAASNDQTTGQPEVQLGFTRHGAKEFQAITKAEYDRGALVAGLHGSSNVYSDQYGQHNAIVLDNKLHATPYIDYTDSALSLGIAGAQAIISNMGSIQAANNLALVLQSGSLPYRFQRVSLRTCSR